MKHFLSTIDTINNGIGVTLSLVVLHFMIGITVLEVISRFAFNNPTTWVFEMTQLVFGVFVVVGGAYTLLKKGHIRSDVFWSRLTPRNRAIVDLATCGFAFLFLSVMLWFTTKVAWLSTLILEHTTSPFGPPLYLFKIGVAIGALLVLLQLIVKTIRDVQLVSKGVEY